MTATQNIDGKALTATASVLCLVWLAFLCMGQAIKCIEAREKAHAILWCIATAMCGMLIMAAATLTFLYLYG